MEGRGCLSEGEGEEKTCLLFTKITAEGEDMEHTFVRTCCGSKWENIVFGNIFETLSLI